MLVEDSDLEAQELLKVLYEARKKKSEMLLLTTPTKVSSSAVAEQLTVSPESSGATGAAVQVTPVGPETSPTVEEGSPRVKVILSDKERQKFVRDLFDYNRVVVDNRVKSAVYASTMFKDVISTLEDHDRTVLKVEANGAFLNSEIRDKFLAGRTLSASEVERLQDVDKKMHTPCKQETSRLTSIPANCTKHTSCDDYKEHLKIRKEWLAVLDAFLDGCVHPRLPQNTGDLRDIQGKAAKELQKFLFGTLVKVKYGNVNAKAEYYEVPTHKKIFKDLRNHHAQRNRDERKFVRGKRKKLRNTIKGIKGLISDDENISGYSELESPANSPEGVTFGIGRGRSYVDNNMYEERRVEIINKAVHRSGGSFQESIGEERKVTTTTRSSALNKNRKENSMESAQNLQDNVSGRKRKAPCQGQGEKVKSSNKANDSRGNSSSSSSSSSSNSSRGNYKPFSVEDPAISSESQHQDDDFYPMNTYTSEPISSEDENEEQGEEGDDDKSNKESSSEDEDE